MMLQDPEEKRTFTVLYSGLPKNDCEVLQQVSQPIRQKLFDIYRKKKPLMVASRELADYYSD